MGDKAQKRLSSLLVLATFVALQIPLKRLFAEMVPGKRGPREDVAEALVQGVSRMAAVVLASTFVRGVAARRGSGQDRAVMKGRRHGGTRLKVSLEPGA
jgi:cation transporter-like permease